MDKAELIQQAIEQIKAIGGYRILQLQGQPWFYVVTPKRNLLYIQCEHFGRGYDVTFEYMPSAQNGSGCNATNSKPVKSFDKETLEQCENIGFRYAFRLGAKLYPSIDAWKRYEMRFGNEYEEVA